jgi:hypothetical protein
VNKRKGVDIDAITTQKADVPRVDNEKPEDNTA